MKNRQLNSKLVWFSVLFAGLILSVFVIRSAGRQTFRLMNKAPRTSGRLSTLPHIIVWAWERPEKLDFLDKDKVGVAFLAKTLNLRADKVVSRPRLQPLALSPGTQLIAVARIESTASNGPDRASLSSAQMENTVSEIAALAHLPKVIAVQIDFDATVSERAFYADLLTHLRQALPLETGLSITALASWCKGDNWLDNLPIDEAVPMLFRMGVDRSRIVSDLASGGSFSAPLCRQSFGVSTDESLANAPASERVYVFNPNSWSPKSLETVLEKYQR
jgi:hypothetical protein